MISVEVNVTVAIMFSYFDEQSFSLGPTLKNESFYDKPKTPSPQPNMQACEAYSTLPDLI